MQITYFDFEPADCTSDPHPVSYADKKVRKTRMTVIMSDIVKVLKSDMVQGVRSVHGVHNGVTYMSDTYDDSDIYNKQKLASGPMVVKHKISGLYFVEDGVSRSDYCDVKSARHISPGLTGVKQFFAVVQKKPEKFESLRVGVVWTFAGSASCSDYIEWGGSGDFSSEDTVNYGSQDYWIENKGYVPWCKKMQALLNRDFPIDYSNKRATADE